MKRNWFLAVVLVASSSAAQNGGESDEFFESRIRPVLADNCFVCPSSAYIFAGADVYGTVIHDILA